MNASDIVIGPAPLLPERSIPRLKQVGNRIVAAHIATRVHETHHRFLTPLGIEHSFRFATVFCLQFRHYKTGEILIQKGEQARELFFLARGNVSVFLNFPAGTRKRLATFSAGMAFGEMALLDRGPRSAMVVADTEVHCDLLAVDDFEALSVRDPHIKIKLLENLSLGLSQRLRDARRGLGVFN